MATKLLICCTLVAVLFIEQAAAYYCDSDKCIGDNYCCGLNICCTSYNVWQMWYFWCGLVFFVFLLSACAGFCMYRNYNTYIIIDSGATYTRIEEGSTLYKPVPATFDKMNHHQYAVAPQYTTTPSQAQAYNTAPGDTGILHSYK